VRTDHVRLGSDTTDLVIKNFRNCGISNNLDGCEDDLVSDNDDNKINSDGTDSSSEAYQYL
jgi:hypothetical protein